MVFIFQLHYARLSGKNTGKWKNGKEIRRWRDEYFDGVPGVFTSLSTSTN